MAATVKIEKNEIVIRLPVEQSPQPSQSGKTLVLASTRGFVRSTATFQGKDISVSVNAVIKKD